MKSALGINASGVIITDNITELKVLPNGNYRFITPLSGPPFMVRMSDIKDVGDIFFTYDEEDVFHDIVKMINPEVKQMMESVNKTFKFNYLFHGPQGTGKGMFTQRVINELEKIWNGPVMVFSDQIDEALSIDRWVRTTFGEKHDVLMVFIEDECENYMHEYKKILDSAISPSNMVSFWLTNKLFKIDETVWEDRPSRIALHHLFGNLEVEESRDFIDFLIVKFQKQGLMEQFTPAQIDLAKTRLTGKSKDYIASELLMQLILLKLDINKKTKEEPVKAEE